MSNEPGINLGEFYSRHAQEAMLAAEAIEAEADILQRTHPADAEVIVKVKQMLQSANELCEYAQETERTAKRMEGVLYVFRR